MRHLFTFLALLLPLTASLAQNTSVKGTVFDSESGDVIPFATITFLGTNIGVMSTELGDYFISTDEKVSRISISSLGYHTQYIPLQKGVPQNINVALKEKLISLEAAEVAVDKRAKNPSVPLMKKVVDAKKQNNPELIDSLSYDFYERLELDFNDIPDKLIKRKIWGDYDMIWDYLDSSEARVSLPVFFSESLGDVKLKQSPKKKEKHVEHTRSTWFVNEQNTSSIISEFVDINLYDNIILIINKQFISPLHDRGGLHYRYYVLDTLKQENRDVFHIAFVPRRRGELTFEGDMWIDTLTYGLSKVKAKMSEGANLNFIRKMSWEQDYFLQENRWLLKRQQSLMDLNLTGKKIGKYAKVNSIYSNFNLHTEFSKDDWTSDRDLSFEKEPKTLSDEEWNELRPDALLPRELEVLEMVDSIKSSKNFWFVNGAGFGLTTGYVPVGPFEIGKLFNLVSYNAHEDLRFSLNLSLNRRKNPDLRPVVYAAYGLGDEKLKYGAEVKWIQKRQPRLEWFVSHYNDIEQLGSFSYHDHGSIWNTLFTPSDSTIVFATVKESEASMTGDFGKGFSSYLGARHIQITPEGGANSEVHTDPSFETTVMLMYQKNLKFIGGQYNRVGLGQRKPRYTLTVTKGWDGVLGSMYDYERYTVAASWITRHGPLGRFEWNVDGGTYTGDAPFTLMELHPSNTAYISVPTSFNVIRNMEFVSESWAKAMVEWHGEGLFFNRVPLLKRLGLREVVGAKAVKGFWDGDDPSANTHGLNDIYGEMTFGIENILTFLSVNVHYRMIDPVDAQQKFAIKVGVFAEL